MQNNIATIRVSFPIVSAKGEGWSVKFISDPSAKVEVEGRKPDLNEFRSAFLTSPYPISAIDALHAAACFAFDVADKVGE